MWTQKSWDGVAWAFWWRTCSSLAAQCIYNGQTVEQRGGAVAHINTKANDAADKEEGLPDLSKAVFTGQRSSGYKHLRDNAVGNVF